MAWIAPDNDESVFIFENKPYRSDKNYFWTTGELGYFYEIPKPVCVWILGYVPTWKDEPIEIIGKNHEN